jgi:hydrogenase maturation protease
LFLPDFGIRGLDLAYALGQPYRGVILVDTITPTGFPGRIEIIVPEANTIDAGRFDNHGWDPVAVLGMARRLGSLPPQMFLFGCEPSDQGHEADGGQEESMSMGLSAPVAASVERASEIVLELARKLLGHDRRGVPALNLL